MRREDNEEQNRVEGEQRHRQTREVACAVGGSKASRHDKNSTIAPVRHPASSIHAKSMCGGVVARLGLCVSCRGLAEVAQSETVQTFNGEFESSPTHRDR